MMKKSLIAIFLMISIGISSAYAGGVEVARHYFDGFYLGAHGGMTYGNTHIFYITDYSQTNTNERLRLNDTYADKAVGVGGLNLGYGWVVAHHYYLGLELFGTLGTLSNSVSYLEIPTIASQSRAYVTAEFQGRYGITFKPGYLVTPETLLYLQVGMVWSQVRANAEIANFNLSGAPASGFRSSALATRTLMGLRVGFGVDRALNRNWHMWLSYLYSNYGNMGNFGRNRVNTFVAVAILNINVMQIRMQTNTLLGGVTYYFGS